MSFKLDWHPANIAAQWPEGSVVLVRYNDPSPEAHGYFYFVVQCFTRNLARKDYQYLLLEEPKGNNERVSRRQACGADMA